MKSTKGPGAPLMESVWNVVSLGPVCFVYGFASAQNCLPITKHTGGQLLNSYRWFAEDGRFFNIVTTMPRSLPLLEAVR